MKKKEYYLVDEKVSPAIYTFEDNKLVYIFANWYDGPVGGPGRPTSIQSLHVHCKDCNRTIRRLSRAEVFIRKL